MQPRSILTAAALLIAALFILHVPAVMANTHTWEGNVSVNWSHANNWDPNQVPDTTDDVIIPSTGVTNEPTFDVDDTVASVTIQSGRTLTVNADMTVTGTITVNSGGSMVMNSGDVECQFLTVSGAVTTGANTLAITGENGLTINAGTLPNGLLNVDGAGSVVLSGGGTSQTIDGELRLSVLDSTLSITASCTVDKSGMVAGSIVGHSNDAVIFVDSGITFTSEINIVGAMQIDATSATFQNDGVVDANDGTTEDTRDRLTLDSGTFTGSGQWKVTAENAYLQFADGITASSLTGAFTIDGAGVLEIYEDVTTTGSFTCNSGWVDIENEATFTYLSGQLGETPITSDCECGSCP